MDKPTIPHRKITANPSRLVDCPPADERTRLAARHEINEGQPDMQMMQAEHFKAGHEISMVEALSLVDEAGSAIWDRQMAEYVVIRRAAEIHDAQIYRPISDKLHEDWPGYEHVSPHDGRYAAYAADRAASGLDKAGEESERLWDAEDKARRPLLAAPAPHPEALLWKLEHLFGKARIDEEGGHTPSWSAKFVEPFFDDIRRMACSGPSFRLAEARTTKRTDVDLYWQNAMRNFVEAKAAFEMEKGSESLCNLMIETENRLRKIAAPDLAAVEWKLTSLRHQAKGCMLSPSDLDDVLADIRRLAEAQEGEMPAIPTSAKLAHDEEIVTAFRARQQWLGAACFEDPDDALAHQHAVDRATENDKKIEQVNAKSLVGVICKLWVASYHIDGTREYEEAMLRGDYDEIKEVGSPSLLVNSLLQLEKIAGLALLSSGGHQRVIDS